MKDVASDIFLIRMKLQEKHDWRQRKLQIQSSPETDVLTKLCIVQKNKNNDFFSFHWPPKIAEPGWKKNIDNLWESLKSQWMTS